MIHTIVSVDTQIYTPRKPHWPYVKYKERLDMASIGAKRVTLQQMLPIIGASTVGTTIEWYDFFLYGFFSATVFAKLFFSSTLDPVTATILAFTTNLAGFIARPVGGAFFGWFGDRVGRKSALVTTMLLMGISTFLIGILPTYAQIGALAPIILTILRFLQGAGVGGEWGGAVLLTLEHGDDQRRGFWSSWPQTGVPLGLALAALITILFQSLFHGSAFLSLGWRFPFLLSVLLIAIGMIIRLRVMETPVFTALKEEKQLAKSPMIDAFRHNWRDILLVMLAKSAEQAPFYIFTTFLLSYGVKNLKLDVNLLYTGIVLAAVIAFIAIPTFSALSDRIGRKLWYGTGAALMAIFAYPYFLLLGTKNPVVVVLAIVIS